MPTGQQYATNVPQTQLAGGGVGAGSASCTVLSSTSWPSPPFTAAFSLGNADQEVVDVTNVVGTTWTITRNVDGTTGAAHGNGTTVTHVVIGRDYRDFRAHVDANGGNDSQGKAVHGLAGSVVGTTDSQALTNKTLTAPVLGGTATGTYTLGGTPTLSNATLSGTVALSGGNQLNLTGGSTTSPFIGGASTAYTPAWTAASGTAPVLGNGILTGRYFKFGRMVTVFISFQAGTTSVWGGSGNLRFSLPVTGLTPSGFDFKGCGSASMVSGGTNSYDGSCYQDTATTIVMDMPGTANPHSNYWSGTWPQAANIADYVILTYTYEATS